jgi:hypothetical protein
VVGVVGEVVEGVAVVAMAVAAEGVGRVVVGAGTTAHRTRMVPRAHLAMGALEVQVGKG